MQTYTPYFWNKNIETLDRGYTIISQHNKLKIATDLCKKIIKFDSDFGLSIANGGVFVCKSRLSDRYFLCTYAILSDAELNKIRKIK